MLKITDKVLMDTENVTFVDSVTSNFTTNFNEANISYLWCLNLIYPFSLPASHEMFNGKDFSCNRKQLKTCWFGWKVNRVSGLSTLNVEWSSVLLWTSFDAALNQHLTIMLPAPCFTVGMLLMSEEQESCLLISVWKKKKKNFRLMVTQCSSYLIHFSFSQGMKLWAQLCIFITIITKYKI